MRIRFLRPTAASANGYTVMNFEPGDEFDLPDQIALGLIGAGNAEDPAGLAVAPADLATAATTDGPAEGEVDQRGDEGAAGEAVEPGAAGTEAPAPEKRVPGRPRKS